MVEQITLFDLYNIEQEEIDKSDMRWYIRAIHDEDKNMDTFIIWSETRKNAPRTAWKQHGYTFAKLMEHVRKISLTARKDIYLSLQTFLAPFRRQETLFNLNAIAFDIDAHTVVDPSNAMLNILPRLYSEVFESGILPAPSIIIFTGRGLQVVYLLEPLPRQGVPFWAIVGEAMAKRLRIILDTQVDVNLDDNYADVTRVLRIPGTYNTEAGVYSRIISPSADEEPMRYRLDELRDKYLPELIIPKEKPWKKAHEGRVSYLFNAYTLHMARLNDVVKLVELRKGNSIPMDGRRRMVFLYRYWSCFCVGQDAALEAALAFNANFHEPLPEKTVINETKSAEKAYVAWKEDKKKGYNYRNDTLIRMFVITAEEQRHLQTIIGKAEKKARRVKIQRWDHDKRDKEYRDKIEKRNANIYRLLEQGLSYREIAKETGASKSTVQRLAKDKNF